MKLIKMTEKGVCSFSANMRIIKISTLVHGSVTHFHREWNAKIIKNEIPDLVKLGLPHLFILTGL